MLYKVLSITLLLLLLSGCGAASYSVPSKNTEANIINNKDKAYIIFSTEELGAGRGNPIFEYLPEEETFKFVSIMASYQTFIYPVEEGVHYFYSMGGETYDFLKVEASKGKKYFTNIETIFWTFRMTTPIEFEPTVDKDLIAKFKERTLIDNLPKSKIWYEQRKDDPQFKAKVKERFLDWKEDDMEDKTLQAKDGFEI